MNKILIIAAHPDDDILGCGGLMSKYRNQIEFKVIFIAEGSSCRFDKKDIVAENTQKIIKNRNSCGVIALKSLGVKNYHFYNFPCGRLDQVPIIEINKIIENEINKFKPDTVFTHSSDDTNNDHIIVHRATQMATRPGARTFVEKLYTYEILSSTEWRFTKTFSPNYFESLSSALSSIFSNNSRISLTDALSGASRDSLAQVLGCSRSNAVISSRRPNHIRIDVKRRDGVPIDAHVFDGP